jgi:ATP-binding cassette subfamily B protein
VLLFTHRLTAFRYADHVLVLDKGRVVQSGPHDRLAEAEGLYREIYGAQVFLEEAADA